jgi:hypothetical protein
VVTPKPPLLYESFETYYVHAFAGHNGLPVLPLSIHPRNGGGIDNWLVCPWGEFIDPVISSDYAYDGKYSLKMSYRFPSKDKQTNISRVYENPNLDWTGYNAVRFWIKPDGTGRTFQFMVLPQYRTERFPKGTPDKEFYFCDLTLEGVQPMLVTMPFRCFRGPGRLTGGPVNETAFWILEGKAGVGAVYLDKIEVICVPEGATVDAVPLSQPPRLAGDLPVRINAGSVSPYTDPEGQIWLADSDYYRGGDTCCFGDAAVKGEHGDALYCSQRIGVEGYTTPVANGRYRVRLHFAELDIRCNAPGRRAFRVNVCGTDLGTVDVFGEARSLAVALVKEMVTTVEDGTLLITFDPVVNQPALAGLEIIPFRG